MTTTSYGDCAPLIDRPALTAEISVAARNGHRLVLMGRDGAGRFSSLKTALEAQDFKTTPWDLRFVAREADVHQVVGGNLGTVLRRMDKAARAEPAALVLRNLDGCAGSPEEDGIMGLLRSELQGVHRLRIFFTAADPAFIGRHFGAQTGAFFKQGVILPVGGLTDAEIDALSEVLVAPFWEGSARREAVEAAGRRACDMALLLSAMRAVRRRTKKTGELIDRDDVVEALKTILQARKAVYEDLLRNRLSVLQRTVLLAIATGLKAHADRAMTAATGIPKGSLTSTLRYGLIRHGWLVKGTDGLSFGDPFLKCFLSGRFG